MAISLQHNRRPQNNPDNYGQGKRTPPKLRWLFIVLVVSTPLLWILGTIVKEHILIQFKGAVVFDVASIRAPANGFVKKILVRPGEKITKNQLLLKFSSPEVEEKLSYLKKEKKRIEHSLLNLRGPRLNALTENLDVLARDIIESEKVYQAFSSHHLKNNALTSLQLEDARKNVVSAKSNYLQLKNQIKQLTTENATLIEINYTRKINELTNDIRQVAIQRSQFDLTAPASGNIKNIMTYQDEYIPAGQPLINLITDRNLRIIAFVDAKYVNDAHLNARVKVIFSDNTTAFGKIINVPSFAERTPLSFKNPLATRENKLIAIIELTSSVNKKYLVFGVPVKVKLL